MSRPTADTPCRRPLRQFTEEFKAGAVRVVLDEGKTVGDAARDLDLSETAQREWARRSLRQPPTYRYGITTVCGAVGALTPQELTADTENA